MSQKAKKERKRLFTDNAVFLSILGVALCMVGELSGLVLEAVNGTSELWQTALIYLEFTGMWVVVLLWMFIFKKNRPIFGALSVKPVSFVKTFAAGFLIGGGLNGLLVLFAWANDDIHLYFSVFDPLALLFIFVSVFIQSSSEELLCRVFLYQRLIKTYKPAVAILVNPVVFAFLHIFNDNVTIIGILCVFNVGILCSLIVYYFDAPWCAFALHTAWNFSQNIVFGLPNSGLVLPYSIFKLDAATAVNSPFYDTGFGPEGSLAAVAVTLAAIAAVCFVGRKRKTKVHGVWQEAQPAGQNIENKQ